MTDSQYYLVCFLLSTLLFHFIFNQLLKLKTHPKLPPSPPTLPVISTSFRQHFTNLCKSSPPNMALFSISALVSLNALWFHRPQWPLKYLKFMIFLSRITKRLLSQRRHRMETLDFSVHHMVIIGGSSRNCA